MFLARRITRAKWGESPSVSVNGLPADAITADLRTHDNTLSLWACGEGNQEDVEEAALAIAAAGDRVDKIDLVWVPAKELAGDGQSVEQVAGRKGRTGAFFDTRE